MSVERAMRTTKRSAHDEEEYNLRIRLIDECYWASKGRKSNRYYMRRAAMRLNVSERTAYGWRKEFLTLVAEWMGWEPTKKSA